MSLVLDGPVDWLGFGVWLTMLLHARGREILRVKGLLDVGGEGPLLVDAVQHVVHPPVHLDAWPDDDHRSRLVLIGRRLDAGAARAVAALVRDAMTRCRSSSPLPKAAGDFRDVLRRRAGIVAERDPRERIPISQAS